MEQESYNFILPMHSPLVEELTLPLEADEV
jgi:hypothetical protein